MNTNPDALRWVIPVVVSALSAFLGILVGAWLTSRREASQRQHAFLERQLRDFYSPLLGLRKEIRAKSELRVKISAAADNEWRRLCNEARDTARPEENLARLRETRWPAFEGIINYNNQQLAEEIIPAYRRMLTIFRDNLWLADETTRRFLPQLIEFVGIWNRWLGRTIPSEVVERLGHTEESLNPFYEHVERMHDELRQRLSRGKA